MSWGLPGGGGRSCEMRAPSEFSGALFTHRDTHTLPFIWAGPLTSTEKGFFQGCLAANCWVDWRAAQMKEKPARTLPPLSVFSPLRALSRPQAPAPPAQLPLPPEAPWADTAPTLAGGPGMGATRSQAPHHLLLLPASGCQVSGRPGSMKQSIVRLC